MTVRPVSQACSHSKEIRIGGSRSKNGCSTCKIRKVKCDETKPNCKRCTSTGRKCDGYEPAPEVRIRGWRQSYEIPAAPPAWPLVHHSSSNRPRGWEYFYHCCFEQVFGGSQFRWIKALIVQLGQQEEAVNSAVVAFSFMHEAAFRSSLGKGSTTKQLPGSKLDGNSNSILSAGESVVATAAYNDSIRALQQAIDRRGRVAVPAALVCCILFAALNMVQCDYDGAVCHIEHGLGILAKEQSIERSGGNLCLPGWSATAADGAMSALVSGFHRLTIAAFFYGRTDTLLRERITLVPSALVEQCSSDVVPLRDMDEARTSLAVLAGRTLKFAAEFSGYRYGAVTPPDECFYRRDMQLEYLHSWRASFRAISATVASEPPKGAESRMVHIVLETQFLSLVILLRTCLDADESGYDSCFDEFRAILALCDEYIALYVGSLQPLGLQRKGGDFTFDMEIMPQLWLVGKKCRHRQHRRWCIELLEKYPRKEGVWDPRLICSLAKRTMEIEEAGLSPGDSSPPDNLDRLWTVDLDSRYAHGSLAVFTYKPAGLGGRGLSWEEMVLIKTRQ